MPTPEDFYNDEQEADTKAKRDNVRLRLKVRQLETRLEQQSSLLNLFDYLDEAKPKPPKWLNPERPKESHATLMLLLSDLHFDEVVDLAEMDGLNAYNRDIATRRLERWGRHVVKLARHYLSGVRYDGVVLMLAGDTFSGNIHEELKETNAALLFQSLLYWVEQLLGALQMLAEEFGKVHVVAVPGNHGRQTRKPRFKGRAGDNIDWLLAKLLERDCKHDSRFSFQIPDSFDAWFQVYGRGQLLYHGETGGGFGIGGIWPPIMRMRAKYAQVHMAIGKPFETLWIGHWHQLIATPSLVINGSMKGYDEFAKGHQFVPEPAQQAMALITPENGISWQCPVLCADRVAEGW